MRAARRPPREPGRAGERSGSTQSATGPSWMPAHTRSMPRRAGQGSVGPRRRLRVTGRCVASLVVEAARDARGARSLPVGGADSPASFGLLPAARRLAGRRVEACESGVRCARVWQGENRAVRSIYKRYATGRARTGHAKPGRDCRARAVRHVQRRARARAGVCAAGAAFAAEAEHGCAECARNPVRRGLITVGRAGGPQRQAGGRC